MRECKHCKKLFDISDKSKGWMANHVRWCEKNPKFLDHRDIASKLNVHKVNFENQFSKAKKENRIVEISEITREKFRASSRGRKHSNETKTKISESSLKSTHRRLRKNPIVYNGILMDSTWEVELAKRLDFLNINWERPLPLKWVDDNNLEHNYFPDFYLIDFNVYLDPKNIHAYNVQKYKIDKLLKTYNNIFFILSLEECENFDIESIQDH